MALKVGELYASFGIDSSGIDSAISGIEKKCSGIASSLTKTGAVLSATVTAPIIAFAKETYNIGTDFQAQMSRVQGISEATDQQLKQLTQTAKDLGASSTFSASQAAEGMEYLASAGFKVDEIIAAMPGMLDLAASSGEDLGTSADIAASILRGFGMEASEAAHVADVLAKNAANTNAAVYDTGEAMKFVAPLANTMGLSFEEVTAAIGLMANAGIKGSQAGTTLRGALSRLAKPTKVMQETMDELGLSFYDSAGQMKSMPDMISMLQTSMSGLTEEQQQNALVTLFGQEALSGMMVLLEAGPEALAEMAAAYENCDGAASEMAEIMLNNLKGAMEGFNGAVETAQLNLYDRFAPAMTEAVQKATELVNSFNLLDDATKDTIYKVVGLAAAAGPAMIGLGGIVGAVGKLLPLMGALISPIGIVTAGVALFGVAAVDAGNDIGKGFVKLSKSMKKSLSDINKNLTNQIKTVSKRIPALASSISEGLGEILPEAMNTAMLVVTGFAETIADNASSLADIGLTIVTSIVDGVSGGLPQLIPAGAKMVTSIASALIGNAPRLLESIGTLAKSIWEGIRNTDWIGLGKQVITAISTAMSDIVTLASGWFEDAKTAIQNINWSEVASSIKSSINIASDWLKNMIAGDAGSDTVTWKSIGSSIWTSIKSGISATGDWLKELILPDSYTASDASWATVGSVVWGAIKSGISVTGDWLKSLVLGDSYTPDAGWSSVGSAIWEQVKTGVSATGDWIKGLVLGDTYTADASWSTVGASIWEKIQSGITATGDWVKSLILGNAFTADSSWTDVGEEIVNKISSGLANLDLTGEALSAKMASLGSFVQNLVTTMLESKADNTAAITSFVTGLVGSISSFDGWSALSTSFNTIAGALIDGIVDAIPSLSSAATSIINSLGDMLNSLDWEQIEVNLEGFGNVLVNGLTKGIDSLGDAGTQIISALGSVLSSIDWEALGDTAKSIGDVLIDGIVSGIGSLANAGSQLVDALSDVISNINWEEAGTAAADLAGSLFNGLLEGAATITPDVSELLSAIGRGIAAAGDGLGEAASTIVSSLIQGLVSPENWESLIKTGAVIIDGLVVGMLDLGMGVLEGAAKTIGGVFEGIFIGLGIIPDYSEETKASLQKTIDVVNSYGEELAMSVEWATGNLKTLGGAVSHSMAGTSSEWLRLAMESWTAVSTQGTAELIAQYQEFSWLGVSQITDCFAILTDTTSSEIQQAAAIIALQDLGLDEFITNATADMDPAIRAAMGKTLAYLQSEGIDSFEAAFAMLGITIPESVQAGLDAGLPLVEAAAAAAVNAASTANEQATAEAAASATGEGITTSLADAEKDGTSTVSDATTGVKDAATLALETLPDAAELMGTKATTGLSTSIDNGKSAVVTSMETLSSEAVEAALKEMSYETGYDTGRKYVEGMQKGISSLQAAVSAVAATVASNAKNTASSILSFSIGSGIGYQFSNGIAQGIRNGIGLITSAASAAAQAAVTASTSTLDINSPSGVGRDEVGKMWDVGIAEGVWKNSSFIFAAARDVVSSMRDEFLVGDPSRGTVYTSGQTVRQTAKETAASANESKSMLERAKAIGLAIAEELIDSGALDGDFYVDGEKTGRKVAGSVSRKINRDSKKTITGRTGKAVLA